MRMHRFYTKEVSFGTKQIRILDTDILHQWRNVFRYNTGSKVIVFPDDGFEYECVILHLTNREAALEVLDKIEGKRGVPLLVLYQSLIKKGNMEWIVEKATELGVSKIVPIISEHSEKKGFNIERAKKIAIEASEQCGRTDVPEIAPMIDLDEAINESKNAIVFDKSGEVPTKIALEVHADFSAEKSAQVLTSSCSQANSPAIFVGPEGGWSPNEIQKFQDANMKILSLGNLTLRAETAAIVALTTSRLLGL